MPSPGQGVAVGQSGSANRVRAVTRCVGLEEGDARLMTRVCVQLGDSALGCMTLPVTHCRGSTSGKGQCCKGQ